MYAEKGSGEHLGEPGPKLQDFDRRTYKTLLVITNEALPIRNAGTHHAVRSGVVKLILPYVMSMFGSHRRSRYRRYEGYDYEILASLSEYGLPSHCVPTQAGGTCVVHEWGGVAERTQAD